MEEIKIGAILILYQPDLSVTLPAIRTLYPQVNEICIVDNTPNQNIEERFTSFGNVTYISLNNNLGIAAAQNIGIQYFLKKKFDYLLFSDQDSCASPNIVSELIEDYQNVKRRGFNIGLIGPLPINKKTLKPYRHTSIKTLNINGNSYIECETIISSFSLIPLRRFYEIGLYNESLFIDFVENEWCFRLRESKRLSPYISERLKINHELGQSKTFLGLPISISSPFRIYFQFRNYLWLRKISYIPSRWKKAILKKLLLKLIYYPIIPKKRIHYMQRILKGLKDGLLNNLPQNRTFNQP